MWIDNHGMEEHYGSHPTYKYEFVMSLRGREQPVTEAEFVRWDRQLAAGDVDSLSDWLFGFLGHLLKNERRERTAQNQNDRRQSSCSRRPGSEEREGTREDLLIAFRRLCGSCLRLKKMKDA